MLCVDGGNVNRPITPKERERERRDWREREKTEYVMGNQERKIQPFQIVSIH